MSKSRKKPDSEVDPDPAVVDSPGTVVENGNQVVGSKKQRIDSGDKEQAFEEKNFGKETEENTNEEQNNSTEENKVEVSQAINSVETTQDAKRASISNEYEKEDKDDNSMKNHHHLETPTESVEVSPAIKSAETTEDANRARITNEHEEEGKDNLKEDEEHLETPMETAEVPPAVKSAPITKDTKRARISNDHEEEDKDDKSKSVDVPPAIKSGPTTQDAKRAKFSNKSEEEDRDDHLETPIKSVEVPPAINSAEISQDENRATSSCEYEEEDRDDNSQKSGTDVEMLDASSLKKTDQTPLSSESPGSKTVLMDNLSCLIQEKDVKNFFKNVGEIAEIHFDMKDDYFTGHGHVEFTTAESAQEAVKLNNTSLLDRPVKLHLATERDEQPTTTPHAAGSKTLFLGNLSFAIEEDDVRDFFKDVGEIAAIRFAIRCERFLGHGYVEFTTVEAAQEALKLNRKVILDRKVKLELARERGVYAPRSSFEKSNSNQREGHAQGQGRTIYVRGFDCSRGFDNIRSRLEKHFGKCGEISRLNIPKDHESGTPRGVAFMDFTESNGFSQALRLDKSEIGGCRITVEEAKNKRWDGHEGSGYGGGWGRGSGYGGGESGSGSGWGRGNDYGVGSGRSSGYGGDWSGGGSGRASGGWHREGGWSTREGGSSSRGILGRTSGYGGWRGASGYGGGGFSSSRVGRFSGGSRGGRP